MARVPIGIFHDRFDHGRPERIPIPRLELAETGHDIDVVQRLAIAAAMDRLHLEKRKVGIELDRNVGPSQPDIGEKRAKPTIGLDETFPALIPHAARKIGRRPYQEAPAWRRAGGKPAPQLNSADRRLHRAEKRRRESLDVRWSDLVEACGKVWKLRGIEGIPAVGAFVGPGDIGAAVPNDAEAHGRKNIPSEARGGGHRLAEPETSG